jgi:non-heme chloroperoxidase
MSSIPPGSIPVNGADLFAVEAGSGDPIVLVHGSLADYRTWALQTRELSRRHRVIAYSRRYHFPNDAGPDSPRYSVLSQALDLAEVIRSRANGCAHVVTSSYGGCVALGLALSHPALIRSLVLCEPPLMPWLLKSVEGRVAFAGVEAAQQASDKAFKAGDMKDGVRLFCDMAIGHGVFGAMPERSQARMMENAIELSLEMAAPPEIFFPQFSCEELHRLPTPVLLLGGDRSPSIYGMIMNELAKCLPRLHRLTIPQASHIVHRMNPVAFNEAVLSFIEGS